MDFIIKPCPFCGGRAELRPKLYLTGDVDFELNCIEPRCIERVSKAQIEDVAQAFEELFNSNGERGRKK